MDVVKKIGSIMKDLRAEKNVTLEDVSAATGIGFSQLSKYERGESEARLKSLRKIADYYDVTLDYMFGKSNERRPVVTSERVNELFGSLSENKKKDAIRYLTYLSTSEEEE